MYLEFFFNLGAVLLLLMCFDIKKVLLTCRGQQTTTK